MASLEMLSNVKTELGITDNSSDTLLNYYIDKYTEIAENVTHYDELPSNLNRFVVSSVVESYNRRGHEGESSNSVLGVSTNFSYLDIESGLVSKLKSYRNPLSLIGLR